MGWLAGWSHRKTVTITGQTGAGTNYQINLSIGDASGGDFHLENHCTSFPNDITVTDNDQTSLLDHWVEDLTVDPISMWVEVADDLGSNRDVCVYYDKSGESSASNISNTFLLGDDFPGSSIDTNKWDSGGAVGTWGISGSNTLEQTDDSASSKVLYSVNNYDNFILESKFKTVTSTNDGHYAGFVFRDGDVPNINDEEIYARGYTESGTDYRMQEIPVGGGETWVETGAGFGISHGTWYKIKIVANGTSLIQFWTDEGSGFVKRLERTTDIVHTTGKLSFMSYNGKIEYNDFRLRKYVATEPAFSSAGSEESAGGRLVYGGLVNAGLVGGRLA